MPLTKLVRKMVRSAGYDIKSSIPVDFEKPDLDTVLKVQPYTMTSVERIYSLCKAVRHIVDNKIPGQIVECGVWRGGSMMAVAETLCMLRDTERELYLYDTYQGMSEPTEKDVSITGIDARTKWSARQKEDVTEWCLASLEDVQKTMSLTQYPSHKIHYIPGKVEETIPAQCPEQIALLRLDTDWYESTKHEMIHLFPRLAKGGILILDDYGTWQGAKQAVDEYIKEHQLNLFLSRIDSSGRLAIKID